MGDMKRMKKIILFCKKTNFCRYAVNILRTYFDNDQIMIIEENRDIDLNEMLGTVESEYIVSFLSPWILPQSIINKAKVAAINFHPGSPNYPGTGCYNFALYEQSDKYGVTCHYMKEKVDSGKIIMTSYFDIGQNETVDTLKLKSMIHLLYIFEKIIKGIFIGEKLPKTNEKWLRKPFTRKELNELCFIDYNNMSDKEIELRIKATNFPLEPKYGPYTIVDNEKIYLVKEESYEDNNYCRGRC